MSSHTPTTACLIRRRSAPAHVLSVLIILLGAGGTAQAGTYTVSTCNGGGPFDGWSVSASYYVGAYADCSAFSNGGAPGLSAGQVVFTAAPGTAVVGIGGQFRANQQGGWQVGVYDFSGRRWLYCGPSGPCQTFGDWYGFGAGNFFSSQVGVLQICGSNPCAFQASIAIRSVTLTIADSSQPGVTVNVPGGWTRGTQPVSIDAGDNVGIKRSELLVDGGIARSTDRGCDYTRAAPCPNGTDSYELNTARFADGGHIVWGQAFDPAGNWSRSERPIYVDNTAPGQPGELAVEGGEGWRSTNTFDLSWLTPSQPGVAPIAAVEGETCPAGVKSGEPKCSRGAGPASAFAPKGDAGGSGPDQRRSLIENLKVPAEGAWTQSVWLRDEAGNQNRDTARSVTLRLDSQPPQLAFRQLDPADPTRLRVAASDATSGVARGTIELQRRGEPTWRPLDTQLEDGGFAAALDDENLPDGAYALRARAVDQAGNERSTDQFDGGTPAELALPVRIKTQVAVGKPRKVAIRKRPKGSTRRYRTKLIKRPRSTYGRAVRLQGRLTTPGQNPLTGTAIQVSEQVNVPGSAPRPIGTVTTSRTGRFSFRIAKGPSRLITFRYPGTRTIRAGVGEVDLRVRASTSFRVSRSRVLNGQAVTFRGHLLGGNIPSVGKLVALQAFSRGRWRPFATTRANPGTGRWAYGYRFDGTRGLVRYRFRARVLREATYPFTTGTSGVRRVLVRGAR